MSNPWFRLYSEIIDDEKIRLLAFEDRWHYVAILCLKNSGFFDKQHKGDLLRRGMSVKLGVNGVDLDNLKTRLLEVDLIDDDWNPKGWDRRQFKSDTSAERTRKWREKQGKSKRDDDVTSQKRHCDALDTDTDTDTEQNRKDTSASPPPGLDMEAWGRWVEYRKQIRKPIKPASILAAQRKLAGLGADQARAVEESIANGWQGFFPPKDRPRPEQTSKLREL